MVEISFSDTKKNCALTYSQGPTADPWVTRKQSTSTHQGSLRCNSIVSTPTYVPFTSELFPPGFQTKTGLKPEFLNNFYRKVCHNKFEKIVDLQPLKHSKTDEYSIHISLNKSLVFT